MSDIQNDIENNAEELKGSSDQHLGDAMDGADLEPEGTTEAGNVTGDGELETGAPQQVDTDGVEQDEAERYSFPPDESDG